MFFKIIIIILIIIIIRIKQYVKFILKEEIVAVEVKQGRKKPSIQFDKDEHFRPNTSMADLATLPPVFIPKHGTVTAGNASGINDGASATLIMSEEKAAELGLEPLAFITGAGMGACEPELMGVSPVPAVKDLLKRTGRSIGDYQRFEINEAFASQAISCEKELGIDRSLLNVNGSGISLGHPVGSTGNRILVTLLHELRREGLQRGLATLCGGGGVSLAVELEIPQK